VRAVIVAAVLLSGGCCASQPCCYQATAPCAPPPQCPDPCGMDPTSGYIMQRPEMHDPRGPMPPNN